MFEARLDSLRNWGYNLGNGVYVVRFRAYRECSGVRLKAPKSFAKEAGLKGCSCVVYVGGYSYECRMSVDECVRIRLPAEIGSLILNGGSRAEFWAKVRVGDGRVEVYECRDPQRKLLDFMLRLIPFVEVIGSRSPNYKRGQKYCPNCRIAFYANLERCPYCGYLLRSSPKGGRRRRERRYIDPEKYGVMVEA